MLGKVFFANVSEIQNTIEDGRLYKHCAAFKIDPSEGSESLSHTFEICD